MEKTVIFSEKDMPLIEKIEAYQEKKGLDFSETVKALCENALMGKGGLEWGTFEK